MFNPFKSSWTAIWVVGTLVLGQPAQASLTYVNTAATWSIASTTTTEQRHQEGTATLKIEDDGWWYLYGNQGQTTQFRFISPHQVLIHYDSLSGRQNMTATYGQQLIESTGEVLYTIRHKGGFFRFYVVATDADGYAERQDYLAQQREQQPSLFGQR